MNCDIVIIGGVRFYSHIFGSCVFLYVSRSMSVCVSECVCVCVYGVGHITMTWNCKELFVGLHRFWWYLCRDQVTTGQ